MFRFWGKALTCSRALFENFCPIAGRRFRPDLENRRWSIIIDISDFTFRIKKQVDQPAIQTSAEGYDATRPLAFHAHATRIEPLVRLFDFNEFVETLPLEISTKNVFD